MKNWEVQSKLKVKSKKLKVDELINILLENRGLTKKNEIAEFLNPKLERITSKNLGVSQAQISKAVSRIKKAIKGGEQIVIFGDYDVDGICGTAILWEILNSVGADVMPYIPSRVEEGYGLSKKGIDNLRKKYNGAKIIITVDNGIVANEAVEYANSKGLEVIITDHHIPSKKLPNAFAIVHTIKICGAAVAWVLSRELLSVLGRRFSEESKSVLTFSVQANRKQITEEHLGLVSLATVADVMSLTSYNRTLVKFGLEQIRKTERVGLNKLINLAGIKKEKIGVYELGHIIGPRINAMGRIDEGMESLRLLCTPNVRRAGELAAKLHATNVKRQELTVESVTHAKGIASKSKKIIIISDKSYNPGIIGLIAGRITEEFYRPSIVISEGEITSKGSARSVNGINIIEFIRQAKGLLIDAGGHKGAAGFTIETNKINKLKKILEKLAEKQIDKSLLVRKIRIDCKLPLEFVNSEVFENVSKLAPFGYGNPEPVFLAENVEVESHRFVGKDGNHLKIQFKVPSNSAGRQSSKLKIDGIMFGASKSLKLKPNDKVGIAYSIYENEWLAHRSLGEGGNGNKKLELKIKDIFFK